MVVTLSLMDLSGRDIVPDGSHGCDTVPDGPLVETVLDDPLWLYHCPW
jgi:hypothetical protein